MKTFIRPRTINTIAALSSAAVMLYFLLSLSETVGTKQILPNQIIKTRPDFYLNDVKSRSYNQHGTLEFKLTSQSITHNPVNSSSLLVKPKLEVFDGGARSWIAHSITGIVLNNSNKVELNESVAISSEDQSSLLQTSHLTILTDKKIAKTNKAVRLINPGGFIQANAMHIDLKSKKIALSGNIKGQYDASL